VNLLNNHYPSPICRGYVHSQGDLAESYHLDNKQRMNTYRNGPISHDIFVKLKYHYSD